MVSFEASKEMLADGADGSSVRASVRVVRVAAFVREEVVSSASEGGVGGKRSEDDISMRRFVRKDRRRQLDRKKQCTNWIRQSPGKMKEVERRKQRG